jgi:myo-inositol-1(or 4)-monophosphatase
MTKRGTGLLPDWLTILQTCAENMKQQVRPLLGSAEAKRGFGIGAGGDVKKQIDLAAENALIQTLQDHHVSCTLISEESGTQQIGTSPSEFFLTADPVDGTANAVHGLPFVDISLAVSKKPLLSEVEVALVADVVHDINYTAEKGKGAYKDEKQIKPSNTARLEDAIVGVDFSSFKTQQMVTKLRGVLDTARHLRHLGANALEVCYVADGTSDAFVDIRGKLRVTDLAAAYLILLEAGGIINTPGGTGLDASLDPSQRVSFIAAANKQMYEAITNLLGPS